MTSLPNEHVVLIRERAPAFVSRRVGREVREQLLKLHESIPEGEVIVLDFDGVDVVTPSFVDECLGRLVSRLTLASFRARFRIRAAHADARSLINAVVRNRLQLDERAMPRS